ncbi:hypothetical protein ADICEAN_02092 [Cesiribacter andamanensis AMV16]|uniref:Uncharacterized protein n=1 Tax=Cesiribacter andamanensis AMV16 TaxID=1279009 RepID=M7NWG4_9BACT|nr:hypothetical protein ADICEAN_02092 [Cesiribacter andamanensis AMV16]
MLYGKELAIFFLLRYNENGSQGRKQHALEVKFHFRVLAGDCRTTLSKPKGS